MSLINAVGATYRTDLREINELKSRDSTPNLISALQNSRRNLQNSRPNSGDGCSSFGLPPRSPSSPC